MATNNAIDSNIPIEIAKGGTNATSMGTTDGVIYYDGTKLVTTAAGTAGQLFTSNGAGVAPTYQANPSPSSLVFLNTQTASVSSTLTFTSTYITSTYKTYLVKFTHLVNSTNDVFNMAISTDNGGTYLNSGYVSGAHRSIAATWTRSVGLGTTIAPLCLANSSQPWAGMCGYLLIDLPASAVPGWSGKFSGIDSSGVQYTNVCSGTNTGTTTINNIQFSFASGTITSGSITLYGVAQ